MRSARRHAFRAAGIVLALASGTANGMGVLPNCLDELTVDTRAWAECTHRFSKTNARCKPSKVDMYGTMTQCQKKGYSKQKIDAAMAKGASSAGVPVKKKKPVPPPPTP